MGGGEYLEDWLEYCCIDLADQVKIILNWIKLKLGIRIRDVCVIMVGWNFVFVG